MHGATYSVLPVVSQRRQGARRYLFSAARGESTSPRCAFISASSSVPYTGVTSYLCVMSYLVPYTGVTSYLCVMSYLRDEFRGP